VLNVCLICSALLIVKVTLVITVFFLITVCVSTIFVNKDDKKNRCNRVVSAVSYIAHLLL